MNQKDIKNIEIKLLLSAMHLRYGYDFQNYAFDYTKRRVEKVCKNLDFQSVSDMTKAVLHDPKVFEHLVYTLSITVTEMFRDPFFYSSLRKKVFPELKKLPLIKIWHAGCATGEEVYSLAIALKEEGLYEKSKIYATDFNVEALEKAKEGIYEMKNMKTHTMNYQNSGGKASFGDYYHSKYKKIIMDRSLRDRVTFAHHNLAKDKSFSEMNFIICRNVMIYFDKVLQNRVFDIFTDSLQPKGFLSLGNKESMVFYEREDLFKEIDKEQRIFCLK